MRIQSYNDLSGFNDKLHNVKSNLCSYYYKDKKIFCGNAIKGQDAYRKTSVINMKSPSKELKSRLIEIRKAIKRKYKTFKDGTAESDLLLEKQYQPIIKELRKTASSNIDIKKRSLQLRRNLWIMRRNNL